MSIPTFWSGSDGTDEFRVKVEPDCFDPDEGTLVVLEVAYYSNGSGVAAERGLAWLSSAEAREMAAALNFYADQVDRENKEAA